MKFNQTLSIISPLVSLSGLSGYFDFKGTGVWLQGSAPSTAVQPFTVTLDSNSQSFAQETAKTDENGFLFRDFALSSAQEHSMMVSPLNVVSSLIWEMDLDADMKVVVEDSELFGTASSQDVTTTGVWMAGECIEGVTSSGTCHASTKGWSITYTFVGDAITVWGATGDDQAQYTVTIDGASRTTYGNPNKAATPSMVLAHFSNIGNVEHTLVISSYGDATARFAIDKFEVFGKAATFQSAETKPSLSSSARIGMIVGCVLGCFLIAALAIPIIKRRRAARMGPTLELPTTNNGSSASLELAMEKKHAESRQSEESDFKYGPSLFGLGSPVSPTPVALPPLAYRKDEVVTTKPDPKRSQNALLTRFGW